MEKPTLEYIYFLRTVEKLTLPQIMKATGRCRATVKRALKQYRQLFCFAKKDTVQICVGRNKSAFFLAERNKFQRFLQNTNRLQYYLDKKTIVGSCFSKVTPLFSNFVETQNAQCFF